MHIVTYASADAINRRPDLLDLLLEEYGLQGVIIRDADTKAFEHVRKRGLMALWLAPGLWGNIEAEDGEPTIFPHIEEWDCSAFPAYEQRFPMVCANSPGLAARIGTAYARTTQSLGASGVFATHLRYHHPADLNHLWGCICKECTVRAVEQDVAVGDIPRFLNGLMKALHKLPVDTWHIVEPIPGIHPLIGWWCALTDTDFPMRWFGWKNSTIAHYVAELHTVYTATTCGGIFAHNCFEPILADLVGNRDRTQEDSAWYAPLLGYWSHHVRASVRNLAGWHMALAGQTDLAAVERALATLLGLDAALTDSATGIRRQIRLGAENAASLRRPYYPVLNGTVKNQYGGRAKQFTLQEGLRLARSAGATGVITQGISQLLGNPALDFWY